MRLWTDVEDRHVPRIPFSIGGGEHVLPAQEVARALYVDVVEHEPAIEHGYHDLRAAGVSGSPGIDGIHSARRSGVVPMLTLHKYGIVGPVCGCGKRGDHRIGGPRNAFRRRSDGSDSV